MSQALSLQASPSASPSFTDWRMLCLLPKRYMMAYRPHVILRLPSLSRPLLMSRYCAHANSFTGTSPTAVFVVFVVVVFGIAFITKTTSDWQQWRDDQHHTFRVIVPASAKTGILVLI